MANAADQTTRSIPGRSLITVSTWAADLRLRIAAFLARTWNSNFARIGYATSLV